MDSFQANQFSCDLLLDAYLYHVRIRGRVWSVDILRLEHRVACKCNVISELYHTFLLYLAIATDNINYVENILQVNFMATHYITKFEFNITMHTNIFIL